MKNAKDGFASNELLVVLASLGLLAAVLIPVLTKAGAKSRLARCRANLGQVTRALLQYADEHNAHLPNLAQSRAPGGWWWYKEDVKGYLGLTGPSSPSDKVFACPKDRGYGQEAKLQPFWKMAKFDYTSYVFNGVNLPGIPNVAGRELSTIIAPQKTLLVMEWTAHAPLSWHRSKTGRANAPFYRDAESVVGFADGQVNFIPIYYDGYSAAFTREPILGYAYKYGGD